MFQFGNMVERTHFDAANTSCCNEPVLNFANKPQYAEASKPMKPSDCAAKVEATGCAVLEVHVDEDSGRCANSAGRMRGVKIQCPDLCRDMVQFKGGGKLQGRYGVFESLGMEAGDVMVLNYTPDPSAISNWYDNCSGAGRLTEEFCNGFTLSYTLWGGLDFPNGCGCDCCGENGAFPRPVMTIDAPAALAADWYNTLAVPGFISGDQSCSGGGLAGTFSGVGSSAVDWAGDAQYWSDGAARLITRDPVSAGSASNSTCCGGTIYWSGDDACGGGDVATTTVAARIGSSSIYPAGDAPLAEGTIAQFSGADACAYAAAADLTIQTACVVNSASPLYRYNGYLYRFIVSPLEFSGSHQCSGCCGNGAVEVSFNNGCSGLYSADYRVTRSFSDSAHFGYSFKCRTHYPASGGTVYRVNRTELRCNGTSGASGDLAGDFTSISDCIARISGTAALNISGNTGCSGIVGGSSCCWYWDNGSSGTSFESRVHVSSGSRCCSIESGYGAWVYSGSGALCCPTA